MGRSKAALACLLVLCSVVAAVAGDDDTVKILFPAEKNPCVVMEFTQIEVTILRPSNDTAELPQIIHPYNSSDGAKYTVVGPSNCQARIRTLALEMTHEKGNDKTTLDIQFQGNATEEGLITEWAITIVNVNYYEDNVLIVGNLFNYSADPESSPYYASHGFGLGCPGDDNLKMSGRLNITLTDMKVQPFNQEPGDGTITTAPGEKSLDKCDAAKGDHHTIAIVIAAVTGVLVIIVVAIYVIKNKKRQGSYQTMQ